MSLLGKTIILKGLSQKGKNRVRDHGNIWSVLAETDTILFAPTKKGPWLFIAPNGDTADSKAARWIHSDNDYDFIVKPL